MVTKTIDYEIVDTLNRKMVISNIEVDKKKEGTDAKCARRSWRDSVGSGPTRAKLSQQPVTQTAPVEVTKLVEPVAGRYRAATQVNVVSPEMVERGDRRQVCHRLWMPCWKKSITP